MDRNETYTQKFEAVPSEKTMKDLAEHIENYLELFEDVFIIPKGKLGSKKEIEDALEKTRILIKKLRKGDTSVFKDFDEWDMPQ